MSDLRADERWLPVVGYEGIYEVSDRGRVRSLDRLDSYGRRVRGRDRRQRTHRDGHMQVPLSKDGRTSHRYVHHLVMESFVGERPAGAQCCHNDGNPQNNRVENLRWDSASANVRDAVRHGTQRQARKTTCPRGHLLLAPNLVTSNSGRACRSCGVARSYARTRREDFDPRVADANYERFRPMAGGS